MIGGELTFREVQVAEVGWESAVEETLVFPQEPLSEARWALGKLAATKGSAKLCPLADILSLPVIRIDLHEVERHHFVPGVSLEGEFEIGIPELFSDELADSGRAIVLVEPVDAMLDNDVIGPANRDKGIGDGRSSGLGAVNEDEPMFVGDDH